MTRVGSGAHATKANAAATVHQRHDELFADNAMSDSEGVTGCHQHTDRVARFYSMPDIETSPDSV
jgi:hypothetical protein